MKAVILAAGDGTRLGNKNGRPKILLELAGRTLLERSLDTLSQLGVREFVVVTGYGADQIEAFIRDKRLDEKFKITLVKNERWEEGSARSVLAARRSVDSRFLIVMGDHIFEPQPLKGLLHAEGEFIGVFDSDARYIDIAEATKAEGDDGKVKRVSKTLEEYQYADAGVFLCSERIFPTIERCLEKGKDEWNDVKREWIERGEIYIYDLKGGFWMDIDTEGDIERAERLLFQRLGKPRDGLISRYLNRPLSTRLSRWLVKTPLTPNQVSFISFTVAVLAALLLARGDYLTSATGGVLAQFSSILDGCDGEVARLRGTASKYGAWFDAVLDRIADAFIILGMTYGALVRSRAPWLWIIGFLALAGSFLVSYTESRYESAFEHPWEEEGFSFPSTRDARLFIVMLGGLSGQTVAALAAIIILSAAEVIRRLVVKHPALETSQTV